MGGPVQEKDKIKTNGKKLVNTGTGEITEAPKSRAQEPPKLPVVVQIYYKASMLKLKPEEQKALQQPVNREDIEIRPDGFIYLPQVFVRDKLNHVIGIGQWALVQHSVRMQNNYMYFDGCLFIRGKFIARAMGEQQYFEKNNTQSYASAYEAAKSDCLVRCGKDMGLAKEAWQPAFGREWKKEFAISVFVIKDGKAKIAWRRKNVDPFWNEVPECPKCKSSKSVVVGKPEYGGGFVCFDKKGGCGHAWSQKKKTENKQAQKKSGSIPDPSRPSPDLSNPTTCHQKIVIKFNEIAAKTLLDKKHYKDALMSFLSLFCKKNTLSINNVEPEHAMKVLRFITDEPERVIKSISQFLDFIGNNTNQTKLAESCVEGALNQEQSPKYSPAYVALINAFGVVKTKADLKDWSSSVKSAFIKKQITNNEHTELEALFNNFGKKERSKKK